ncbi:transcriptional regulator family: Fungal Specific TF [Penicillium lividum]|nr:transcriptional regulator family: Fungal Specific TF [Penicillium lividum]
MTPDRNASSMDSIDSRERKGFQQDEITSNDGHRTETGYAGIIPEPRPEINPMPSRYNEPGSDSILAEDIGFQSEDAGYLAGGSSFDLNMVDLLDGADFDSLFDLIGQQYPSF